MRESKKDIKFNAFIKLIHDHQQFLQGNTETGYCLVKNISMTNQIIRGGNLARATITNSAFTNCVFDRLDLTEAMLYGTKFYGCTFRNVSLLGADLAGVLFDSGCKFVTSDVGRADAVRIYVGGVVFSIGENNTKCNCKLKSNSYLLNATPEDAIKEGELEGQVWDHWGSLIKLGIMLKQLEPTKKVELLKEKKDGRE